MFTPFAFIIDPSFYNPTPIAPASQYLLIGGGFTQYNSIVVNRIAQLDSTGSLDSSFNMGIGFQSGILYFLTQQPDGKYLTGGFNISSYNNFTATRIVRINRNGTYDSSFNFGAGPNNNPIKAIPLSDNSNIIVGQFTTYSGSLVNGIVKTTPSGAIDTTFNIGFGFNSNPIYSIDRQSDGKFIVVGNFTQYSASNNYITRTNLSGSRTAGPGSGFNTGVGFNNQVTTMVTQSDGKILVVGGMTT